MIPGLLAQDVAKALRDFISIGYETNSWLFSGKFRQLVETDNNGEAFLKGPYVSVSLPFLKETTGNNFFKGFETKHSPFAHQQKAWQRLASDRQAKSSIVATGTGSGKTECFLYPLLDHCQRNPGSGVKAIIIYPMNALAGDQAKRFAEVIHETGSLKGKIRVGLFVGGQSNNKIMTSQNVITCKDTMRANPPDILLTNYKMLDYLLMRPHDQPLWQYNQPDTLKYLIVDELHTFDGAQGSDLAMLIRRLKARLKIENNSLICSGTSATLGSDASKDELSRFASDIFDTEFSNGSIIGETREIWTSFLDRPEYYSLSHDFKPEDLMRGHNEDLEDYLTRQCRLYFGDEAPASLKTYEDRVKLGRMLKKHTLLFTLLFDLGGPPVPLRTLADSIKKILSPNLANFGEQVLVSFLALVSHARGESYPGEPFASIRLQLWSRELRRIVASVSDTPKDMHLGFADDLANDKENTYLPIVQCTECHTTAWLTTLDTHDTTIQQDLKTIYTRFFSNDHRIHVLLPLEQEHHKPPSKGMVRKLCTSCGNLESNLDDNCSRCQNRKTVLVFDADLNKQYKRSGVNYLESQRNCPTCESENSLILFGSRAASLGSVAIHKMFASNNNDDRKLIAFSDSVQDAAHRGGFFSARTWKNNVRMAIAKTVDHYNRKHNGPVPLNELYSLIPEFWQSNPDNPHSMEPLTYISQFIAPNMLSEQDYNELKRTERLDNPGNLLSLINKRFIWETLTEFGNRSLVGRSLERAGVASLYWDPELIKTAAQHLKSMAYNKLGETLDSEQAQKILWGISLRMKRQGAVYHDILNGFIENGGQYYILSRLPYLPNLQSFSTLPRFPAEKKEKGFEELIPRNRTSWYGQWAIQFIAIDKLRGSEFLKEFIYLAMDALIQSGLLIEKETKSNTKVWALNPDHLFITTDVDTVRLRRPDADESQSRTYGSWYFPTEWLSSIKGLPTLDQKIKDREPDRYEEVSTGEQSDLRDYYRYGEINRVIGHEHTALLEREYREKLEQRFIASKDQRREWYENLLSATPTLEMGIDIGDLSSVLLCSVPPAQANYLQRAGRGGRRDGNSFVLTLANGHPHDLYFYANPSEMLNGNVEAPAIFLNAIMVLRRQLLAYCFDCWGQEMIGEQLIPRSMQPVLDAIDNHNSTRFPYTLLDYIDKNRDVLWDGFETLVHDRVTDDTRERLKDFILETGTGINDDNLRKYILTRLKETADERKELASQRKALENELKKLQNIPEDEEIKKEITERDNELQGIKSLQRSLNTKETLNFFTDEGLLPNYAFPEEGTTLKSVIYRKKRTTPTEANASPYEKETYEYTRPAYAALSELAPESIFYASNRKVQIDRVEMAKGENLEHWRLCPRCHFSADQTKNKDLFDSSCCPRCGDPMWADSGQYKPMAKLRKVYATTSDAASLIDDASDTREPAFYNRQMLVDINPEDVLIAYATKSETHSFGFEFVKKANFKEINFGKYGTDDQPMFVAGQEMSRPGFRICKECGSVQRNNKPPNHMFKCGYRKKSTDLTQKDDGIIDCLYLYRQYSSEAVRILLPRLSAHNPEKQKQSFVAALQLGLKKKFGGKVDHLQITIQTEPVSATDTRNYLVLYDTIPGGTGYLHTLLTGSEKEENPHNLMDALQLAKTVMDDCSCKNIPELDGCYSCLYAYKNSHGMEQTSRRAALELLNEVLPKREELQRIEKLSEVKTNAWSESELERRFPEAIEALSMSNDEKYADVRIYQDIINGKLGFKLEVGRQIYSIIPQKELGQEDGVAYPCRCDFFISADRETDDNIQIAVFLDGYEYHKNTIQTDLMKRQGIFLNSNIRTWNLTWHDLDTIFAGNESKVPNPFREYSENYPRPYIEKIIAELQLDRHGAIFELSPLHMLLEYLREPDREVWGKYVFLRTLYWIDSSQMNSSTALEKIKNDMELLPTQFTEKFPDDIIFASYKHSESDAFKAQLSFAGSKNVINNQDISEYALSYTFSPHNLQEETTRIEWQKMLQLLNTGQFLPLFFACTEDGLRNADFAKLSWDKQQDIPIDRQWTPVIDDADDSMTELLFFLEEHNASLPEVGFELENNRGQVIAEAELAWNIPKIAILRTDQIQDNKASFENQSWTVYTSDSDFQDILGSLKG